MLALGVEEENATKISTVQLTTQTREGGHEEKKRFQGAEADPVQHMKAVGKKEEQAMVFHLIELRKRKRHRNVRKKSRSDPLC